MIRTGEWRLWTSAEDEYGEHWQGEYVDIECKRCGRYIDIDNRETDIARLVAEIEAHDAFFHPEVEA